VLATHKIPHRAGLVQTNQYMRIVDKQVEVSKKILAQQPTNTRVGRLEALRYTELNPLRARLVSEAKLWPGRAQPITAAQKSTMSLDAGDLESPLDRYDLAGVPRGGGNRIEAGRHSPTNTHRPTPEDCGVYSRSREGDATAASATKARTPRKDRYRSKARRTHLRLVENPFSQSTSPVRRLNSEVMGTQFLSYCTVGSELTCASRKPKSSGRCDTGIFTSRR
jgi:hypothetical protein